MSTQIIPPSFDDSFFDQRLPSMYRQILRNFRKLLLSSVLFHTSFCLLLGVELFLFLTFLPLFSKSSILTLILSALFLTAFSYLVLLFYLQAKKPEQISQLCQQFLLSARGLLTVPQGDPQHHLTIAASLTKLASYLDEFEQELYQAPYVIKPLQSAVSKLSMRFHWQDLFRFKQLLLHAAIQEHIYQIRLTPTDLEIHASLANAYVAISKLFAEPAQPAPLNEYRKNKEVYDQNFRTAAQLAVEEFQILHHYAPNDPWVHEQLAAGYRNLAMPEQEVQEIETLLRLRPQDKELLLRLGSLYFAQGMNAKGLRVYEDLKATHYKKAEDLIAAYGASDSARRMFDYL